MLVVLRPGFQSIGLGEILVIGSAILVATSKLMMKSLAKTSSLFTSGRIFSSSSSTLVSFKNPSNLIVDVIIQGADNDNPNGDGSGNVTFVATADNAITYKFISKFISRF